MLLADTLSRHHLEHSTCCTEEIPEGSGNVEDTHKLEETNQLLTSETIAIKFREETQKDQDLQTVKTFIQTGWPKNPTGLNSTVTPYYHIRDKLATQESLVC